MKAISKRVTARRGDAPAAVSHRAQARGDRPGLAAGDQRGALVGAGAALPLALTEVKEKAAGEPRRNIIVEWLLSRKEPRSEYLERLLKIDLAMTLALGDLYELARPNRRMALSLFLDFSRHHDLEAPELAMLMDDANRDALEAYSFLIGGVLAENADDLPLAA